eukprot:scaffold5039_cov119-Cylindrotheca_fusiformis.AAC.6
MERRNNMEETNSNPRKRSKMDEVDSEYDFVYTSETNISEIPKTTMTRLRVDSSVREIPVKAFEDCSALVQVQLPEALSKIGESAFKSCPKLNCVQFVSRNASLKTSSTHDNSEDGLVVFPEGMVLQIDNYAFSSCKSLRKVILCCFCTRLGKGTFEDCQGLVSVHLPKGLQVIEPDLFWLCKSLALVKIPISVIEIGDRAFYGCRSLTTVDLPHGLLEIGEFSFEKCVSMKTLNIPTTVSLIGKSSFQECQELEQVQLPETLSRIRESAFQSCHQLNCVQFVSRNASCDSSSIYSNSEDGLIVFPEGKLAQIDDFAFSSCRRLRKVIVCSVSTELGQGTFNDCQGLLSVHLPEGLRVIEPDSFQRCGSLTNAKIPSSVIKIGDRAFYGCRSLPSVDLPPRLLEIGESSFNSCGSIGTLHIPAAVSSIGKGAFAFCGELVQVQLPETLSRIRESTFQSCSSLKSVQFDSRNASLEASSINENLEDGLLIFREGIVLQIGDGAFSYCLSLRKVIVCSVSTKLGKGTFKGCQGLLAAHLPEGLQVIEPCLFWGCQSLTTFKIPSSVIKIGLGSFEECSRLMSVDLPHGLLEIGESSFGGCESIETFHIRPPVSSIGLRAFYRCSRLKRITLPPTLERIESDTFYECRSLECIEIPSAVSFIGKGAFSRCVSLSHLRFPPSVAEIMNLAFHNCQNLISIELPEEIKFSFNRRNAPVGIFSCRSLVNLAIPTLWEEDEHMNRFHSQTRLFGIGLRRLKHRFDGSPLNKLCYYQSYHSSEDAMAQLRNLMEKDPVAATNQRDEFGMTPLHVISLSQTPNLDMLLAVMKGSHLDHIIQSRDSFGSTPMDYLCLNRTPNSTHVIRRVLQTRFNDLLGSEGSLKSDTIRQAIDEALTVELSCRREEIGKVYFKLAGSERKEILSLLELFLWKIQIDDVSSQEEHVDRLWCRVKSGACFVIPHVLPFLGRLGRECYVPSFPNQPG